MLGLTRVCLHIGWLTLTLVVNLTLSAIFLEISTALTGVLSTIIRVFLGILFAGMLVLILLIYSHVFAVLSQGLIAMASVDLGLGLLLTTVGIGMCLRRT